MCLQHTYTWNSTLFSIKNTSLTLYFPNWTRPHLFYKISALSWARGRILLPHCETPNLLSESFFNPLTKIILRKKLQATYHILTYSILLTPFPFCITCQFCHSNLQKSKIQHACTSNKMWLEKKKNHGGENIKSKECMKYMLKSAS